MNLSVENESKYSNLNITFQQPEKNNSGVYMSQLVTPITVELPYLEIYSVGNKILNGIKEYQIWYSLDLDNEKHKELLELLYYIEEKAIKETYKHSKQWFNGKQLSMKSLENLFVQVYDSDEDSNVIIKLVITDKDLLPHFEGKHYSTIKFTGIRFFTNNFNYLVKVDKVNKIDDNKESSESNINLVDYLNDQINIDTDSKDVITDDVVDNLAEDDSDSIDNLRQYNDNINNSSKNNMTLLPIENKDKTIVKDNNTIEDLNSATTKVSELSKIEIKSVINSKRNTVKRYFLNAERANRAAENLRLKAIRANNDLKKYEELYSQMSVSDNDE